LATQPYTFAYGVYQGTPDPGWGGVFDRSDTPSASNVRGLGVAGDAVLDELFERARQEYDHDVRADIGHQVTAYVRAEAIAFIERYELRTVAVIGDVRGLAPGAYPAGDTWNVREWRVGDGS
jgi:ABC-type transport system substrate-binding protein